MSGLPGIPDAVIEHISLTMQQGPTDLTQQLNPATSGNEMSNGIVYYNNGNVIKSETITHTSAGRISKLSGHIVTIAGGTTAVDFTALTGANGATQDMTGLRLQYIFVRPKPESAPVTITPGAANGYNIGNSASFLNVVTADAPWEQRWINTNPVVAAIDAEIDFAGTNGNEIYLLMGFGTD